MNPQEDRATLHKRAALVAELNVLMAKPKRPKDPASEEAERQAKVIQQSGHPTHGVRRKTRAQQRPLEPKK